MKILDNITNTVRDDLRVEIKKGSRVSIAAACFSMYAYKELKKQLETIDEFEFIFTSPTFVKEKAEKQKREFYIPRISRETSLYGTEFEIKLRNEMTQRAIAKECADWIRRKATFKSNTTGENMAGFMTVDSGAAQTAYMPIGGFTTVDIGCERGNNSYNMVNCMEAPFAQQYMKLFDTLWNDRDKMQDVTDVVLENISTAYAENSPEFIYFMTLYHVFSEFLDDISEDELPNEATGFKQSKIWSLLYDFQKDAVLAIINKLEKYNGCILADSVGLGKTFTALAVVKYYENRNKSVLVLCPKKLAENWNTYKDNYVNNPIASDRLNYDVLFHTDLSRSGGKSNGLDLDRLNWGNYDLVVIDESHNFRNGIGTHSKTQDNRYQRLMDKVIRAGVKTKVLMLSATPVNNRFVDLKNQLALAYEGSSEYLDEKLNTSKSIEDIFKQAQKAFNAWSKLKPEERTTDALLRTLDFDFFELLDSVTIVEFLDHLLEERADRLVVIIDELDRCKPMLKSMFEDGNKPKVLENPLNDRFEKAEFQKLWQTINHKYAYTVDFDSEELIRKAIEYIDRELYVSRLQYTVTYAGQKDVLSADMVREGSSFRDAKSRTKKLEHDYAGQVAYDLIGKIAENTTLTRRTVARILQGIKPTTFAMYQNNPEEFITKVIRLIKEQKATMIVEHITYDTIEGSYDSSIFTAEKHALTMDKAYKAQKAIQDYVFTDGTAEKSVERKFAENLDGAEEVFIYAKLPKGFYIPTPVGHYSPDWAIVFHEGKVKHIYFVAETKGTMESLNLRPIEKSKIDCAKKLFAKLSDGLVTYDHVDSYQELMNKVLQ